MPHISANRVLETTTTTGTGALTLSAAVTGFIRFNAISDAVTGVAIATGDTMECGVWAVDSNGVPTGEWENGLYTYSSANTLTRTTVRASSNSGAAVSFSAGTKYVALGLNAGRFVGVNVNGVAEVPQLAVGDGAMLPAGLKTGAVVYSTTTGRLMYWDGSYWVRNLGVVASGQIIAGGTYGDSRAGLGMQNLCDIRQLGVPLANNVGTTFQMPVGHHVSAYHPAFRYVANGGVSGDSLDQMITRETSTAGPTRRALQDMANAGCKVVIFYMSINQLTADVLDGAYVGATTTAIIAKRDRIIAICNSLGMIAIDLGEMGFDWVADAAYTTARINNIRTAIQAINADAKTKAAASNGRRVHVDAWSLVTDGSTGQWGTDMCSDFASPGQRVHLSSKAAQLVCEAVAATVRSIYGAPETGYHPYIMLPDPGYGLPVRTNTVPNATLDAATSGLATGFGSSVTGSGGAVTNSIVRLDEKNWQSCEFTWSGASGNEGVVSLPTAQFVGTGATVPVKRGEIWGVACECIIDNGAGGAPAYGPISGFAQNARFRPISGSTPNLGNNTHDLMQPTSDSPTFGKAFRGWMIWNPIYMGCNSDQLTSCPWEVRVSTKIAVTGGSKLRVMVSEPIMVKLSDPEPELKGMPIYQKRASFRPGDSTTITQLGSVSTAVGTISHPQPATTNALTRMMRAKYASAGGAGSLSSHRNNVRPLYRGDAIHKGGYNGFMDFGLETMVSGQRGFFGISTHTAAPTNVDPLTSTAESKIGVGFALNTGNLFTIRNAAGTGPTTEDCGASFALANSAAYRVQIIVASAVASVRIIVTNLGTGAMKVFDYTSNIPASNVFMAPLAWMTNNATASLVEMSLGQWEFEWNN